MANTAPKSVDEYISRYPPKSRGILNKIRALVKTVVPDAKEKLGYGVASFNLNGRPLIYYAAFAAHIGIYPIPKSSKALLAKLEGHIKGKGTLQFPLNKPMPYDLVEEIIKQMVAENRKLNTGC